MRCQFKQAIRNNQSNKNEILQQYVQTQKELKEHIERDLQETTRQIANRLVKEGGVKSALFWKLRKQIINQKSENTYDTITEDGVKIENPTEAKEHIANFYENLYQAREGKPQYQTWTNKMKQEVQKLDEQTKTEYKPKNATIKELEKTIKQLKNNKATGPDRIPNEIFTNATHDLKEIYLQSINKIIQTHNIPSQWQEGEIIRLYKGKGTKGKFMLK